MTSSRRPILLITVDTEEDDWGDHACRTPRVSNIDRLPSFQKLCDAYGVVPTYLCNWPVLTREASGAILRELALGSKCGTGAHIHPWNTPPMAESVGPGSSMLCNLPSELIARKLEALSEAFVDRFGTDPKVFRAGRWAFGAGVAAVLAEQGYAVDTSVTPLMDWSDVFGPDYREAPAHPYRFDPADPLRPVSDGVLLEVPATVGFLGRHAGARKAIRDLAARPTPRRLHMIGLVDRLGLARRRWLSPELTTAEDMVVLARSLVTSGARILNFTFHSPTLAPGLTPFTPTRIEQRRFMTRIETFFRFARDEGYRSAAVSEIPTLVDEGEFQTTPKDR